jgi:hypothetical protein
MPTHDFNTENRFNRWVLGSWWIAVAVLGGLRLWQGQTMEAILLLASASLVMLLGVALSIDRARGGEDDTSEMEASRLRKATILFSLIAVATVIGCAVLNAAFWWAALECAALIWILPAVILPQIQAYLRKRSKLGAAT